ncbi:MAG: hypothetical protein KatS3mg087_1189 [Patescibacteria group bacterium]|nr:MAG: hypothetical protein KatS3mg087_1189 [Patescibacteria group bacterium]
MPRLSSLVTIRNELRDIVRKVKKPEDVIVGFTQRYAIFVHERTDLTHRVGQAKFLESAAIEHRDVLAEIVRRVFDTTGDFQQALLVAGLRLQREAQLRTPVDTSALRSSAFTTTEGNLNREADLAFGRSENIRKSAKTKKQ